MIHGFRGVFVSLVNWEPVFPEFPAGLELKELVQGLKHSHYPLQGLRLHLWQKGALSPRSSGVLSPSPKSMLSSAYHCQPDSPAEPQAHPQTMALDLQNKTEAESPRLFSFIRCHFIHSQVKVNCSVMPNSLRPHGLYSPWNSPGQNTGVGSLSLLQGISPTQGLNQAPLIAGGFFTNWAIKEAQYTQKHKYLSVVFSEFWHMYTLMCPLSPNEIQNNLLA